MKATLATILINIGLKLWRTDLSFNQYPFGPPERGLRNRIAWCSYHAGLALRVGEKVE